MLGDRHQLDMGEAHLLHVLRELLRHLPIIEEAGRIVLRPHPRAEMDLVDAEGRVECVGPLAAGHPFVVLPGMVQRPDARGGTRRLFPCEGVRIAFLDRSPLLMRFDVVLVAVAVARLRHEPLPHARAVVPDLERMAVVIPAVEVADDAHARRVGCPHPEPGTRHAIDMAGMRAELVVQAAVAAFLEKVDVVIGHGRGLRAATLG